MKSMKNHGQTAQMTHGHRNSTDIGHHAHHLGGSGGMTHNLSGIGPNATHAMDNTNI